MFRNRSVDVHKFAMIPRAEIPRSSFRIQKTHKTTFDAGYLVPVYLDEILPGDSFNLSMTAFARLATPIVPIMDNLTLDSFFFFVPNRLVWNNWHKFMGEQENPGDSTSYVIPTCGSVGAYPVNSLQDYMGLPTVGQIPGTPSIGYSHSALFLRAYHLIWNEWFRDENLQDRAPVPKDDGPDPPLSYALLKRGKRHDYFTSCLPWPQKGPSVPLPLGAAAPVYGDGTNVNFHADGLSETRVMSIDPSRDIMSTGGAAPTDVRAIRWGFATDGTQTGLYADLSEATAATINQLRQSFQVQKLLERDARGGTRYTEIVRSHFGVISPDARLQRPEYLGGGSTPIAINPIAQTSATGVQGGSTPMGNLAAMGTAVHSGHGFSQSFTEHGMIIGLVSVRADLTYQQGLRKMWSRRTRYDFYFPAFANLGEQAVLNREIYVQGEASDDGVFGYQERWAEYRYNPSTITGRFKSTSATPIDIWHLSQKFNTLPTLNDTFIQENPPLERVLAVSSAAAGSQFLMDCFFDTRAARPMPLYSVPGLIDHF